MGFLPASHEVPWDRPTVLANSSAEEAHCNEELAGSCFIVRGVRVHVSSEGARNPSARAIWRYDYVRYNTNPKISGVPPFESFNANGVSGQIAYNPNNWLGLAAELSGYALARQGWYAGKPDKSRPRTPLLR